MRRTPLKPVGKRRLRWQDHQRRQRQIAEARVTVNVYGVSRCEMIGVPHVLHSAPKRDRPLEWHHIVGRGNKVAEPWASWAPLTAMLCRMCHYRTHEGTEHWQPAQGLSWRDRLREMAVDRLLAMYPTLELPSLAEAVPLLRIKIAVDQLAALGVDPENG